MPVGAIPIIAGIGSSLLGMFGGHSNGKAIGAAGADAREGVQNATSQGQSGVDTTIANANTAGSTAQTTAVGDVNRSTSDANNTLQRGFEGQTSNLNPYLQGGQNGIQALSDYAASKPTFSFAPTQAELENTPGYKFQLGQGTQAVNNASSSSGLLASGNTLEALQNYGQGLAGTYYQNAFKNAQDTFNTNQNTTLANLSTLAGVGLTASNQYNQASQNNYNQQAHNTLNSGYFSGTTGIDMAKYLSSLNLGGSEFNASLGQKGAVDSGNFALEGAGAGAVGNQIANNSLTGGLNQLGNSLPTFLKGLHLGGGSGGQYNPEPGVWE